MFKKLKTVIYHVSDIAAAKEWYTRATGIEPYFDQPFYVGFDINGCELGLDPDNTNTTPGNQSVCYWSVDDVAAGLEKLSSLGGMIVTEKNNVGGDIFVGVVADPFGNHIGLIQGA
jgi:predicted enzyme related to lactoylglutathione lyase